MTDFLFNEELYGESFLQGLCLVSGATAPFIDVCPAEFDRLKKQADKDRRYTPGALFDLLRERLGDEYYAKVRGAVDFTLTVSRTFFPAYCLFYDEFLNDEWLALVDWHKFHRDHAVHQSMTAYIGMSLLKGEILEEDKKTIKGFKPRSGKRLLDICVDSIMNPGPADYLKIYLRDHGASERYFDGTLRARALWENLFLDTFFLAALFHDLGYPWKFVNIVHDKLKSHSPLENPSDKSAEWISRHYGKRLLFYPLNGYRESGASAPADWSGNLEKLVKLSISKTHGFPGAVSFLHLNDILRTYPEDRSKPAGLFCIDWAAMAIMMHDMSGVYDIRDKETPAIRKYPQLRLRLERDPLSTMLTLCDIIQDFSRPDAVFTCGSGTSKTPGVDTSVKYVPGCTGTKLTWDASAGNLKITYQFKNRGPYNNKKKRLDEENELLFAPGRGYLDLSYAGIKNVSLEAEIV